MNLAAKFDAPEFLSATEKIRDVCSRYQIPCGVHQVKPDKEALMLRIAEGYRFIAYSLDSVFLNASVSAPRLTNS
jgi:2-dehydro-3-deoxyglucarate aldolase